MGKSEAWEWVTVLIAKTHPDVQCNFCGKVIRNCQLGRDLLPHAGNNCPDAPDEVVDSAFEQMDKAAGLKATRKPSGGAAHSRVRRYVQRMASCFDDSEDEAEESHRRYWEGKERFWRMCEEAEKAEQGKAA